MTRLNVRQRKTWQKSIALVTMIFASFIFTAAAFAGVPGELQKAGPYYQAKTGSYLNCDRVLFAATGALVAGNPLVTDTGVLVNAEGLMFETTRTDADDKPIWDPIMEGETGKEVQASLDLRTVIVVCEERAAAPDNIDLLLGAAKGNTMVQKAKQMNLDRVMQDLVQKSAALIAAAQTGTKIDPTNLPPEVLSEMTNIAKKYTQDNMVTFLKAYGKLLNWDDADIARIINLLSSSRIDAYNKAMDWAGQQGYALNGTPTQNTAAMEMNPSYDAPTRGTIYFDFVAGTHRVSNMNLDASFEIRQIVSKQSGEIFIVALHEDGTPLAGQLFVDEDTNGKWVSGQALMAERAEILSPTLTVQQAAALSLNAAKVGQATRSSVTQPANPQ